MNSNTVNNDSDRKQGFDVHSSTSLQIFGFRPFFGRSSERQRRSFSSQRTILWSPEARERPTIRPQFLYSLILLIWKYQCHSQVRWNNHSTRRKKLRRCWCLKQLECFLRPTCKTFLASAVHRISEVRGFSCKSYGLSAYFRDLYQVLLQFHITDARGSPRGFAEQGNIGKISKGTREH